MKDNIEKLTEKYPLVFEHMSTGAYSSIPDGWYDLLDKTCAKINVVLEECYKTHPPDELGLSAFIVEQIKEKFGTLRFYFSFNTQNKKAFEEITNIVDGAELDSHEICEVTGKLGELCVDGHWFKTLSEEVRQLPDYKDYKVFTKDLLS